jgi:hypothetical protein
MGRMVWTHTRPSTPGYYWHRRHIRITIVRVLVQEGILVMTDDGKAIPITDCPAEDQWAGPLDMGRVKP